MRIIGQVRAKQTVLVVTANRFLGESLAQLFRPDKAFRLLNAIEFSPFIAQEVLEAKPDIVVLSAEWDQKAFHATRAIREAVPQTKILMIGMKDDPETFLNAVQAGAVGFLLKEAPAKQILAAAHRLRRNLIVCPEHLEWVLFRFVADGFGKRTRWGQQIPELTPREQQLVFFIAQGLANKEIADRLHVSLQTVKNHVHSVLQKTGSKNRSELSRFSDSPAAGAASQVIRIGLSETESSRQLQ